MGKDKTEESQPVTRAVPEAVEDTKVRTPGEEPGQVETREAKQPEDGGTTSSVFPEPTGTDNGQPTTLKPSAAG